jgi:hypothetical protein
MTSVGDEPKYKAIPSRTLRGPIKIIRRVAIAHRKRKQNLPVASSGTFLRAKSDSVSTGAKGDVAVLSRAYCSMLIEEGRRDNWHATGMALTDAIP